MDFEFSVPVLVVGGGACGAVAALAARDAGAEVLVIEADDRPLGSTGMSLGLMCAAGTKAQVAAGVEDSAEALFEDIMQKSRGTADPAVARALAEGSGPAVNWLAERHGIPLDLDTGFRPSFGNRTYRMHGWPGHGGEDLLGLLHRRLAETGVDVLLEARLADVVADADGRIRGALIERPDGGIERIGCDTLVLACGGFAANREMLARFIPEMADARNHGHEGSQGTAVRIGEALGAGVGDMGSYQGYAMLADPQGVSVPPQVIVEGGVIVNRDGRRFVDESEDIAGMVHPVLAQPGGAVWVIYDARIEAATAYITDMKLLNEIGAAKRAEGAEALAAVTGLPADALAATLAEAHAARSAGAADATGRRWGDETPPDGALRALRVVGAIYHTQGGLEIDGAARVLRSDGAPLPNLFAGGGAARSVSGPAGWGYLPAMGLCTAVTLGRIAGMSAAAQALHPTGR